MAERPRSPRARRSFFMVMPSRELIHKSAGEGVTSGRTDDRDWIGGTAGAVVFELVALTVKQDAHIGRRKKGAVGIEGAVHDLDVWRLHVAGTAIDDRYRRDGTAGQHRQALRRVAGRRTTGLVQAEVGAVASIAAAKEANQRRLAEPESCIDNCDRIYDAARDGAGRRRRADAYPHRRVRQILDEEVGARLRLSQHQLRRAARGDRTVSDE